MGKILQFRCVNENCPSNFSYRILSERTTDALSRAGAFSQANTLPCGVCGKPSVADIVPQGGTLAQRAEHDRMLEATVEGLRQTSELVRNLLGKKALPQ